PYQPRANGGLRRPSDILRLAPFTAGAVTGLLREEQRGREPARVHRNPRRAGVAPRHGRLDRSRDRRSGVEAMSAPAVPADAGRSWWLHDALALHAGEPAPSLDRDTAADVVILGGGYTGM